MCFDIWFLAKSIGVGDISQASVCLPVCLFQYFLKKYNNMFENIVGTFKGYYLIILKLFSRLSCCPVELVWHISFPIFAYRYFFLLKFLKTIQLLQINFLCACARCYSASYLTKKKLFAKSPPLLAAILRYSGVHFEVSSSILESCSILCCEILFIWFLY